MICRTISVYFADALRPGKKEIAFRKGRRVSPSNLAGKLFVLSLWGTLHPPSAARMISCKTGRSFSGGSGSPRSAAAEKTAISIAIRQ